MSDNARFLFRYFLIPGNPHNVNVRKYVRDPSAQRDRLAERVTVGKIVAHIAVIRDKIYFTVALVFLGREYLHIVRGNPVIARDELSRDLDVIPDLDVARVVRKLLRRVFRVLGGLGGFSPFSLLPRLRFRALRVGRASSLPAFLRDASVVNYHCKGDR